MPLLVQVVLGWSSISYLHNYIPEFLFHFLLRPLESLHEIISYTPTS